MYARFTYGNLGLITCNASIVYSPCQTVAGRYKIHWTRTEMASLGAERRDRRRGVDTG